MMDILKLFSNVTSKDKNEAIEILIAHSTPRRDFFLMVVLSIAMAVFGIYLHSVVILIGSMLIAPVLYPVLTVALGMTISDVSLIKRSLYTLGKSILFALVISIVISIFLGTESVTIEGITNNSDIVIYGAVAIVSGIAASCAMAKPQLNEAFPGVAVSVSLVPPLASIGVGIAALDMSIIRPATLIFMVNVLGIVFSSMIVFSLLNLYTKKEIATEELEKQDKQLEQEKREG